jgi:hypothetical protein
VRYDTEDEALRALRAPTDIAAGAYMENGRPTVARVVRDGDDLALVLDDGGEMPAKYVTGAMFTNQERALVRYWRTMPGERRFTFLALAALLAVEPEGPTIPKIVRDAMDKYSGGHEADTHDVIASKAFKDAARAQGAKL